MELINGLHLQLQMKIKNYCQESWLLPWHWQQQADTGVPCYIGHTVMNTTSRFSPSCFYTGETLLLVLETTTGNLAQSLPLVAKALKPSYFMKPLHRSFLRTLKESTLITFSLFHYLKYCLWHLTDVLPILTSFKTHRHPTKRKLDINGRKKLCQWFSGISFCASCSLSHLSFKQANSPRSN